MTESLMPPERLAEIEARWKAAAPGPWTVEAKQYGFCRFWADDPCLRGRDPRTCQDWECEIFYRDRGARIAGMEDLVLSDGSVRMSEARGLSDETAEFVVSSRADVPDLVAEVRRQAAEIERLRAEREWLVDKFQEGHEKNVFGSGCKGCDICDDRDPEDSYVPSCREALERRMAQSFSFKKMRLENKYEDEDIFDLAARG